jgi:predicted dehydrogenase
MRCGICATGGFRAQTVDLRPRAVLAGGLALASVFQPPLAPPMHLPTAPRSISRRSFLRTALAAGVPPLVVPARVRSALAPSQRLHLGFIGVGGHGFGYNLKHFLNEEDCRAVAVCDAFRDRTQKAANAVNEKYADSGCKTVADFREIIADPGVDAVVISTPDHWHVPMALLALAAGKHVFCEKPTFVIGEGRTLAAAVKKSGLTFATGLEDRSVIQYHKLIEWLRNGAIGDLYHIDVTLPPGRIHPAEPEAPVPTGLDWEMWLGPAPFHPYTPTRTGWLNWRMIRDYSTGMLTDWGTHLVDTAQLAANDPHGWPVDVKAWGQPVPPGSQSDLPGAFEVHYRYANGVTLAVKTGDKSDLGPNAFIRLLGSKGWISNTGWRGRFEASDPAILQIKYAPGQSRHWPLPPGEHRNFLDAVRHRQTPTYSAETLHRLCTPLHAGLIAMDLGRPLRWDSKKEEFIGDPEANRRLGRKTRDAWQRR